MSEPFYTSIEEILQEYGLETSVSDTRSIRKQLFDRIKSVHPDITQKQETDPRLLRLLAALEFVESVSGSAEADSGLMPALLQDSVYLRAELGSLQREVRSERILRDSWESIRRRFHRPILTSKVLATLATFSLGLAQSSDWYPALLFRANNLVPAIRAEIQRDISVDHRQLRDLIDKQVSAIARDSLLTPKGEEIRLFYRRMTDRQSGSDWLSNYTPSERASSTLRTYMSSYAEFVKSLIDSLASRWSPLPFSDYSQATAGLGGNRFYGWGDIVAKAEAISDEAQQIEMNVQKKVMEVKESRKETVSLYSLLALVPIGIFYFLIRRREENSKTWVRFLESEEGLLAVWGCLKDHWLVAEREPRYFTFLELARAVSAGGITRIDLKRRGNTVDALLSEKIAESIAEKLESRGAVFQLRPIDVERRFAIIPRAAAPVSSAPEGKRTP